MQITQVDILNSDSDSDSGSDPPEIAAKTSTMLATSSSTYSSGTCIFFFMTRFATMLYFLTVLVHEFFFCNVTSLQQCYIFLV